MNCKPTHGHSFGQRPGIITTRKPVARMRQAGQSLTEYAMLITMVGILCVSVLKAIGTSTGGSFESASEALGADSSSQHPSGSGPIGGNRGAQISYRPGTNSFFEVRQ